MKRLLLLALIVLACACNPPSSTETTTTTTTTSTSTTTSTTTTLPAPAWPDHGHSGNVAHDYTGTGPTVAVLGDSLTYGSWDDIYADLTTTHAVRLAAWFGEAFDGGPFTDRTGIYFAGAVVDEDAPTNPDVVVIALGTNTVWHDGTHPDNLDLALSNEASALADFPDACKVWVTLPVDPGAANWDPVWAQTLNTDAATWADETADWAGAVQSDPSLLTAGHVHATAAGYAVRAQLIADAVTSCGDTP